MEEQAAESNFNVNLTNLTEDLSVIGVAGPKSRAILQSLTNVDLSNDKFAFLQCKDIDLAGT